MLTQLPCIGVFDRFTPTSQESFELVCNVLSRSQETHLSTLTIGIAISSDVASEFLYLFNINFAPPTKSNHDQEGQQARSAAWESVTRLQNIDYPQMIGILHTASTA